jgi:hypothetical protein
VGMWWLFLVESPQVNEKWSGREELELGRCLDPLVVLINIYMNKYDIVRILVSMFWGCGEG